MTTIPNFKDVKKHLCLILCLLSVFLVGCESEAEKKMWRSVLPNKKINGVTNPYMIDKMIYRYAGYDKEDRIYSDLCSFRVFTLKNEIAQQSNLLNYLRQFDSKRLTTEWQQNSKIQLIVDDGVTEVAWINRQDLTPQIFNPFNGKENPFYQRFNECIDFLGDNAERKKFIDNYPYLYFLEKFRTKKLANLYSKEQFYQTVISNDAAIKLRYYCSTGYVYFINAKEKLFIELTLNLNSQLHKKYTNPQCN